MNPNDPKQIPSKPIIPNRYRTLSQSAFTTSLRDRPIVHSPQHIDDHGRRCSTININERKYFRFDEGSLQMTNDPNSVFYRRLSETLEKQNSPIDIRPTEEQEKFKLLEKYGPDLVEFIKDREGHIKSKFDKVFIT